MKNETKKIISSSKTKIILIGLGIFALLLRFLFSLNPQLTENIYSKGIFQVVRFFLDYTFGLLPFPVIYPAAGLFVLFLLCKIIKKTTAQTVLNPSPRGGAWRMRLLKSVLTLGAFFGALVFFFYFLWGFNYQRLPIETHLDIKPVPLDITAIRKEAGKAFQATSAARQEIRGAGQAALGPGSLPKNLENKIRGSLKKVLESMTYPTPGRVRARKFKPAGLLMSFAVSGVYFPYTGAGYIPADITVSEIPFCMAHEMAHGFGFAEEGTANFLAYLACITADDPLIRYSGRLEYFFHISAELYRAAAGEYRDLIKKLPPGIQADRRAIYRNWAQYRGWLMKVGEKVNDAYLKSQGIREGIKSYNRLIVLIAAFRASASGGGAAHPTY